MKYKIKLLNEEDQEIEVDVNEKLFEDKAQIEDYLFGKVQIISEDE